MSVQSNTHLIQFSSQLKDAQYGSPPTAKGQDANIMIVGRESCAPDYEIQRSEFPYWTLELIVDGHGQFQSDKESTPLHPGSLFCFGPGVPHHFHNHRDSPFEKYFLVHKDRTYPKAWKDAGLQPAKVHYLRRRALLQSVLGAMLAECSGEVDRYTVKIVDSLESQLLALFQRFQMATPRTDQTSQEAYDLAIRLLSRDFKNIHSLEALAHRTGYSSAYLCRLFRRFHGTSPYQVLTDLKMKHAWLLLREGRMRVKAVAQSVGFEDPLHFSRVFRKVVGCAPSEVYPAKPMLKGPA